MFQTGCRKTFDVYRIHKAIGAQNGLLHKKFDIRSIRITES